MNSLATPAELATYLQTATQEEADAGNPNVLDTTRALQALAAASSKVRGAAGWSISEETTTKTLSSWTDHVFLPVMNVTDVAVTVGGQPAALGAHYSDLGAGVLQFSRYWTSAPIAITYTAGYTEVPDGPKSLCLEIAAEIYFNPTNDVSTTYGNVTEQHRPPATAANPEDLRVDARLSPYVVMGFA